VLRREISTLNDCGKRMVSMPRYITPFKVQVAACSVCWYMRRCWWASIAPMSGMMLGARIDW